MSNISRDSFRETQNALNDLRGLLPQAQPNPKHYVGIRLQQGVPLLDAAFNEMDDIRRVELETILARAIGSGVPAGSDGFRIRQHVSNNNNFNIEPGLLFVDGWLAYNPTRVDYAAQPHRSSPGIAPALPPLDSAATNRRDLIYLDAWELEVDSQTDDNLLNPRIGVETCTRLQRAWVVRFTTIATSADPLNPIMIPNRQARHRYYPLATIDRTPGVQITDAMINDIRRTQLTLDALTFPPLLIDDVARGQRLESSRLASVFRNHLDVMREVLTRTPEIFVFPSREAQTWQAMTAFNDVRASALSFEQEALAQILHRKAAMVAMRAFYQEQKSMLETLARIVASGVGVVATGAFVQQYRALLDGAANDARSVKFAVDNDDLLGAVIAQDRLNQTFAAQSDTLPEGTITASLVSITPTGQVKDKNSVANYQLTIRIQSQLTSKRTSEPIRAIASAGTGWNLQFVGSNEADQRELVVEVPNQQSRDVVLMFSANPGAANTTLNLTVRPERRQQSVFTNPPVTLAIGQEVLPSRVIASLSYQGPTLQPNNTASVTRAVMASATGVKIPFGINNLSSATEVYQVTVTAIDPLNGNPITATGWQAPNQPVLQPMAPGETGTAAIVFRTTDQSGAKSPVAWRVQLTRVTGGVNEPLTNTKFDLTFVLT